MKVLESLKLQGDSVEGNNSFRHLSNVKVGVGFPSLLSSIDTPDSAEIVIEVRVKKY